jgi:arylsulfatase A-like enzyme
MENEEIIEEEPDQSLLTKRYTEKAVEFIRQHKNQPFFLYLPYTFPHVPLYASEAFLDKSLRGLYGDVVEEIDWSVGEILETLAELGIDKDTLVFFTSDNGPWLVKEIEGGSAGLLREGKHTTWEGGVREPAIAWWPDTISAGSVSRAVTSTMDLFPTLAGLAGVGIPDDREIDGYDLSPILKQEKETVRDSLLYYREDELFAVRMGPWKAHFKTVEKPYSGAIIEEHEPPLLFNIEVDPSERFNIAEDFPDILAEIKQVAERHRSNLDPKPCQLIKRLEPGD